MWFGFRELIMPSRQRSVVFLLLAWTCLSLLSRIYAQFPNKEKFYAVQKDVPHIRCETCQKAVKYLYRRTNEMREKTPSKKVEEDKIIELVEKSCNPDKEEGEWLSQFDITKQGDTLQLREQDSYGKCRVECKTVAKACEESIGEIDTDLAEILWQNKLSLSKLTNKICHKMSSACSKKTKQLKVGKRFDEEFMPMSEDERKADKVLKQMRGVPGMPGMEMYSRDDIAKAKEAMMQQAKPQEDQKELPIDEEGLLYEGGGVSFMHMAKDCLIRLWAWIRGLFTFLSKKHEL